MSTLKTDYQGNVTGTGASGTYIQIGAVRFYGFSTAITANSTATTAPAGSIAATSHATGIGKIFRSDGLLWQFAAVS